MYILLTDEDILDKVQTHTLLLRARIFLAHAQGHSRQQQSVPRKRLLNCSLLQWKQYSLRFDVPSVLSFSERI
jgi:hypothetical protein